MWNFANSNTISALAGCGHEDKWEKCSQTLRGRKKGKFQYGYQFGLLDVKVLADSNFKWPFEMTSFLDSDLGKISDLVANKLKCRFRVTGVFEKNWQVSQFFFYLNLTWRLFGCWCNRHREQFGQIKLT